MNILISLLFLSLMVVPFIESHCPTEGWSHCKEWDYELRISRLEAKLDAMMKSSEQCQTELTVTQKLVKEKFCSKPTPTNSTWELKRETIALPQLAKLALHQVKPTYVVSIPKTFPANTKSIIISVLCNFWNKGGHAYLNGDIKQIGNTQGGVTKIENTHFKVYANTFYYEVFVPWDMNALNQIQFDVTNSYQTGGGDNWYRLEIVGYITA